MSAAVDTAFIHPNPGVFGRTLAGVVNCPKVLALRRATISRMPFIKLASDVRDVVYLNWVVPTQRLMPYVPRGIDLVSQNGSSIFTVLSYQHGHFGPVMAGPLRYLFPSPRQSNWRVYVDRISGRTPDFPTILFVKNVFDSTLYTAVTRVFSDSIPSHLARRFDHRCDADRFETRIEGGSGSAPDLAHTSTPGQEKALPADFMPFYENWERAVVDLCLQDCAIAPVPGIDRIAEAKISVPIEIRDVTPHVSVAYEPGELLRSIGAEASPFCFYVPRVKFTVLSETLL